MRIVKLAGLGIFSLGLRDGSIHSSSLGHGFVGLDTHDNEVAITIFCDEYGLSAGMAEVRNFSRVP
ncbi:MAG: hypothetical protein BHW25_02085 [Faecalibacterium sp. CAG:82-related_59_9]|nr:MAG: hypothetical protein BHW25_02085 [Faecalibacterium sp. CAG:82-related_59_9]